MPVAPALPVELISQILDYVVKDDAVSSPRQTYPTLRTAALISRVWRYPACQALWLDVEITSVGQAVAFKFSLLAGPGPYKTERISIAKTSNISKALDPVFPELKDLLARLTDLKELEVGARIPLRAADADFLYLKSLSKLSSLTVRSALIHDQRLALPPFHLSHLKLSGTFNRYYARSIIISSATTLKTLDLHDVQGDVHIMIDESPIPLPNLSTFKFNQCSESYAWYSIPSFPKLQHLVTRLLDPIDLEGIFATIESPLRTLELSNTVVGDKGFEYYDVEEICQMLAEEIQDCAGLSKLEVVRVGWSRQFLEEFGEGLNLLRVVDRKGIRMEGLAEDSS
ncbi:hypothetical protein P7C70_g7466, partial [Phenoliferia sp. Uapishka_3]